MRSFQKTLQESISIREIMAKDEAMAQEFERIVEVIANCFEQRGKLLLCGNGGSAADAQHIAAELSGRFNKDRAPLFAEALHVNASYLTAVANDYGYDAVFARMTEAMGRKGDVLIGISTSGNSENVFRAIEKARVIGMTSVAFLGQNEGQIGGLVDHAILVPSENTARIQEVHITLGHILCEELENRLF